MKQRTRKILTIASGIGAAGLLVAASYVAGSASSTSTAYQSAATYEAVPGAGGVADSSAGGSYSGQPAPEQRAVAPQSEADTGGRDDRLVIRNAGMSLRVDDVPTGVESVRSLAQRYRAEITELYVDTATEGERPLDAETDGPTSAQITVRVAAKGLDRMTADLEKLGVVLSQTASASDVTEQYVDLDARLKNLRAEEARLRAFFDRAESVKDLLAVQSELSRVRGEIEAMTAQVTYLERQVARATLTISLSEPGPIVSPSGDDWGFRQALTDGLRGAVAVVTTAITVLIGVSPLLLLGLAVWLAVVVVRNRRRRGTGVATVTEGTDGERLP